jgi:hypothetical protein
MEVYEAIDLHAVGGCLLFEGVPLFLAAFLP